MASADQLAYMTATELAARVRRRELSPVEVIDAFIERIQARNDSLNALVYARNGLVIFSGQKLTIGPRQLLLGWAGPQSSGGT